MKVLFIGTTDILGGAAKISWTLKNALEEKGDSPSMFVADKRSDDENVKTIPRQKWRKILGYLLATDGLTNTDWVLKTPEFKNADIVHCHNLHGRFFNLKTLKKMSKIKPVIWTLHDEWAITPHCACTLEGSEMKHGLFVCPSKKTEPKILWDNTKKIARDKIEIYSHSNFNVVTPSLWLQERVRKTALGTHPLHHIPNGIDTKTFSKTNRNTARTELGLPLDKKIILFVADGGKDNPWKGWPYAEKMISLLNDREDVLFLNVGKMTPEILKENNVEYRPRVSDQSQLALYYSAADVLLFTSIAENFPLVILEAMSCGLPIVSFDVGGVKEVLVHKENGYIANYRDDQDLERGLQWALSLSQEEKEMLANKSIEKIRTQYDTSIMTTNYMELYNKVLSK